MGIHEYDSFEKIKLKLLRFDIYFSCTKAMADQENLFSGEKIIIKFKLKYGVNI